MLKGSLGVTDKVDKVADMWPGGHGFKPWKQPLAEMQTFYVDSWWGPTATTAIFIAAALTDWLDGYLARKMNLGTTFGAFLDPVADKLMVAATLVLLCTKPLESSVFGQLPWLLTVPSIAIIGREITMSAVREWASYQGGKLSEAVAVNNLGKWKTATQMIALTILLLTRDSSLSGAGTLVASGVILLYISAWLAVWFRSTSSRASVVFQSQQLELPVSPHPSRI
ncbi:Cardiolipin synthase (CMP-forming), mitochondrial [Capsicum annuum]|nr:Cardiolipin synthase (CMP-forming), mitochondrial [Capsicum annuum]